MLSKPNKKATRRACGLMMLIRCSGLLKIVRSSISYFAPVRLINASLEKSCNLAWTPRQALRTVADAKYYQDLAFVTLARLDSASEFAVMVILLLVGMGCPISRFPFRFQRMHFSLA
jgi:hypothetical protein